MRTELPSFEDSFFSVIIELVFGSNASIDASVGILSLTSTSRIKDLTASQLRCMLDKPLFDRERFFFIK